MCVCVCVPIWGAAFRSNCSSTSSCRTRASTPSRSGRAARCSIRRGARPSTSRSRSNRRATGRVPDVNRVRAASPSLTFPGNVSRVDALECNASGDDEATSEQQRARAGIRDASPEDGALHVFRFEYARSGVACGLWRIHQHSEAPGEPARESGSLWDRDRQRSPLVQCARVEDCTHAARQTSATKVSITWRRCGPATSRLHARRGDRRRPSGGLRHGSLGPADRTLSAASRIEESRSFERA